MFFGCASDVRVDFVPGITWQRSNGGALSVDCQTPCTPVEAEKLLQDLLVVNVPLEGF